MKQIALFLLSLGNLFAQSGLIPEPVTYRQTAGEFRLGPQVGISPGAGVSDQFVALVQAQLRATTGLSVVVKKAKSTIGMRIDKNQITQTEGYQLHVSKQGISLTGHDEAGLFYGVQSLIQLVSQSKAATIPACDITDYPVSRTGVCIST
ncbi:glycoside hydrolase family 20 zincin-like fold domain-containing protein [Spirosoma telluris]|uniref:glycoside hydrolase family 20 zincin-like fold domain-containing protein n=1 Tax=Spirosoma telluris TaxID=2183553 RepID=UPI0018DEB2CE